VKRLCILRHAKADPAAPGDNSSAADHARPLAPRGRADAAALGASGALAPPPQLVLVSSSKRTRETLACLGGLDAVETQVRDDLYHAAPNDLRVVLAALPETVGSVLLIGHNPGLHDLCLALGEDTAHQAGPRHRRLAEQLADGFPTSALATFELQDAWASLAPDAPAAPTAAPTLTGLSLPPHRS